MNIWLWAVIGICVILIAALFIKIHLLQKAAKEIEDAFAKRLISDTNTLITISTRDPYLRSLAASLNVQLGILCRERRRFLQGDLELKNAVTNISHDLRTPLTAICGYLDLLEQEETSEPVTRYLDIIRNRTDILTQLTEELFRYSVILATEEDLHMEPVNMNHILEESIAALYTSFKERQITPRVQLPQNKIIRNLDASALARIFANLLNNAIKYSDGDLDIVLCENGEIIFANSAEGLDEVQTGRLFDRFYTLENAKKSTGLGLAIARTLVEQMNGTITAEYTDQRFIIRLRF